MVQNGSREPLLEARGIIKTFGHVRALDGADFTVYPEEVVALIGDNGAGKSTLVKILSGVLRPDAGLILLEGHGVSINSPKHARQQGIETVYQDLALAPDLDSAANVFLGRELLRGGLLGRLGFLDNQAMHRQAQDLFTKLRVPITSSSVRVAPLSGGQQQGVAVCRSVNWANRVLFLDEPTAALGVVQTQNVLSLIRQVASLGIAVVLVSHSMPVVLDVAHRVEVLRLGRRVAQFRSSETTMEQLVGAMTGARGDSEVAA